MSSTVNINDRDGLQKLLSQLKPDTKPLFGLMTAQQMVEHLVEQVEYTNGIRSATCGRSPEEALQRKTHMLSADVEFPKNVVTKPPTDEVKFGSIAEATTELLQALAGFDHYFETPDATAVHAGFGPMNHDEWLIWHNKHFAHHFEQFGLIEEA